ncbi:PREDICTED: probable fatty acyl-CoA reductase 4 [Lupinus angustifolius]|uniref:probable fatty acyl-CoA reductase 4 n=1 Tax=Lupinus angustifolius TaxID=3871 RepID=UPI00092E4DE1|nr:PREDICTED: probable fatty acyl-CoA reductase 4 [Lupinus angustifolius]
MYTMPMMELRNVSDFFKGKTILVTGATGFLAKVFVEKILRVQPDIKKLYLLVRASDPYLATQRLHNEIFKKDLFRVVQDKWGADFGSFICNKVVAVAGDVSRDMFGLIDVKLSQEMLDDINIIVHSAASTNLDERFDVAMGTNTMGAFNVLNFAKSCRKIEIILHVSTAYVCGPGEGLVAEEPIHMGQTLNNSPRLLDINLEKHLIKEKLSELHAQNANEETITKTMKEFGMIRANLHGWQDTYSFTKAMGEMIMGNMKDNLHLIVTRPTMIVGTHSEPFPGWIEEVRTIDFLIAAYCKGTLTSFVGHSEIVLDTIPVDMVVNSMIIALLAHSKNLFKNWIYHSASSLRNPFKYSDLQDIMYSYFTKNPWVDQYGKPVVVTKKLTLYSTSMDQLPLNKGSKLERISDLYKPYFLFQGIFDDKNAEKLRIATKGVPGMNKEFNFDPKAINWKDYMMNIHFPGLVKYSIRSKM